MTSESSGSGARAWKAVDGGLRLEVRLQPGAGAERIEGLETQADGTVVVKVRVTAPPEDGKANAALIKLLAKRWKLPKSSIALLTGERARRKSLLLRGPSDALAARLADDFAGPAEDSASGDGQNSR